MLQQLTAESLASIDDGKIKAALDMHLAKVVSDCMDRPGSDAARTVSIELAITPCLDPDTGECSDVNVEFTIGSKVPKHRSRTINCKVRKSQKGGMLLFNDLSEENAAQTTLDEADRSGKVNAAGDAA